LIESPASLPSNTRRTLSCVETSKRDGSVAISPPSQTRATTESVASGALAGTSTCTSRSLVRVTLSGDLLVSDSR
jgi:hypothetical protein